MSRRLLPAAALVAAAFAALPACTREVTRLSFPRPGSAETTADLASGDVVFAVDAEWTPAVRGGGLAGLESYKLTVVAVQHRKVAAVADCRPLRLASTGWSRESSAARVKVVDNRLADCRLTLPKGGPTTLKATLAESRKSEVQLHYLDLVVEQ